MFWRVAGFTQPSPVETLLDKENFTLEELLNEDDLIQECKALNGRLINFLKERSTVEKLLQYLVQAPPEEEGAEPKQQFKYSFAACEVFCCEVDGIFNTLLDDNTLLELLFSLLQQEGSLHCVTAGYFARVVGTLLFRRTGDVMRYLESHQSVLQQLVQHLDTTSIAEIVVRLVGAEEQTGMYLTPSQVGWLTETNLMELLLERLGPGFPADAQKHAAEIMAAVARSQLSPLVKIMATPECLGVIFERAFTCEGPSSVQALDVCIALLEPKAGEMDSYGGYGVSMVHGGPSQEQRSQLQTKAVVGILPYCGRLLGMLDESREPEEEDGPTSMPRPRLGSARLKAVETVAALVRVGNADADAALVAAGLVPRCLDLFLRFPFNNLLHHQVTTMLMGVLEAGTEQLVAHVFEAASLLTWLVTAPVEVQPPGRAEDSGRQERRPLRAGYMGHITYIANKLLEASHGSGQVLHYLEACEPWQQYVEGTLKERNVVENVMQWACGRPNAAELNGMSGEVEDVEQLMELEPLSQQPEPAADAVPNFFATKASAESPDAADADGPVYRDASIAFESLQLAPPQLGSQAGAAEGPVLPAAENTGRSASPPGAGEVRGSAGQGSTGSAAVDSLEGTEPSDSKPWDGAAVTQSEGLAVDEGSAGASSAEHAASSPPALTAAMESSTGAGLGGVSSGRPGSNPAAEPSNEAPAGVSDAPASAKAAKEAADSEGQGAWKPTWPAEEAAAPAPPTAPIAVPQRSADISIKSSSLEDAAAAAVGFAGPEGTAAVAFPKSEGAAAALSGSGDARRGSDKAAADGSRGGLATGGLAAALAEEKQISASEAGGSARESGEEGDAGDASASASVQLPSEESSMVLPPEGLGAEPCESGTGQ